ncbi:PPOX class F420-dependent oxidoreductase [Streptomyces sp. NHF165]|uniref:PPOX class F420-dependent oxidoreductase n=1 Tax=Streptomyces sp. NHF165 TaxID=2175864 RepID=UPI003FCC8D0F
MRTMGESEWREFVLTGTRTGKLATHRADGRPHVTPVWFLLDEGEGGEAGRGTGRGRGGGVGTGDGQAVPMVVFTTWHASLKHKALRRDPRFSLCIDDQAPPFSYVMLECTAGFTDDPDTVRFWATRIAERYMGPDRAAEYGERNAVPGEYLVRATIDNIVSFQGVAD